MDIGKMISQVINLITKPKQALQEVSTQSMTRKDIIIYLAIVGIPSFIGMLVGYAVFGFFGIGFLVPGIIGAVVYYIVAIIGVIIFGYILNAFAQTFKSQPNQAQALKLTAYASTPWLLAGIFYIYPLLWPLAMLAGIYGLYILYLGLPILMGTPKDQQIVYLIVSAVILFVIMGVLYFVTNLIVWNIAWASVGGYYYNSIPRGYYKYF